MSFVPNAHDRLLALINQANPSAPKPIDATDLYLGTARLDTSATDGISSVVPTVGMLGTVYTGYQDFKYKRLNLSTAYDFIPVMQSVGSTSLYNMLDIVNAFLGLNFTQADVVDTSVATVADGAAVNINIQTKPGSLGYVGSMVLEFRRIRPEMTAVLRNPILPVLTHEIDPSQHKLDVGMLMWNVDMSPYNLLNMVGANGAWKNPALIAFIMNQQFGFTDWPTAAVKTVADYATTQYPGANTTFQRVAVQTGVVGATYEGTALFHYNPS
jgi:hypothetical protein